MTFKDLGLKESILESISKLGFETPSPIQEQVIPYLLNTFFQMLLFFYISSLCCNSNFSKSC